MLKNPNEVVNEHTDWASRCVFVEGAAGCGKTFIYNALYHWANAHGTDEDPKKFSGLFMAFTGIAATLLPSGGTLHKIIGLPLNMDNDSSSNIEHNTPAAKRLTDAAFFVI